MSNFNKLYSKLINDNTSAGVLGTGPYAAGDSRPIEPARITLGAKFAKKKKNEASQQMTSIPIQRRPKIENILAKRK